MALALLPPGEVAPGATGEKSLSGEFRFASVLARIALEQIESAMNGGSK